jgi:pimeloyl-ACP methyl ester carboxylesterase
MPEIKRRYISVEGRSVHLRMVGAGPPLVMLHGSPGDSEMLISEMTAASHRFTCIAFDTPGFGDSAPLPGDTLTVADLADATAAAMATLGLGPCRVYGTHSGAAIALELGVRWPEQVSGLVLEGVPIFTEEEMTALFEGYFAPLVPSPLGGHLTETWMRFRDQFIWFPWTSRSVHRLNPVDRPTPEEVDPWVSMFYRSCKTYRPAYRAACFYGPLALRAAEALTTPCVYMAAREDMLFLHLDRLPPLKPGQSIERLEDSGASKHSAIARFASALPGGWSALPPLAAPSDPNRMFVDTPSGQVFVRRYGQPGSPALILLHDTPGSGLGVTGLAEGLAARFHVLVPDLPANGRSDAPAVAASVLEASGDAIAAIADAFDLPSFILAARGYGAAVAAQVAERGDPRLLAVFMDAPPVGPDEAAAAAVAPDLPLSAEGAHWVKAWMMLRDGQIYAPWYDGRIVAQRTTQGNFDAQWLHDQTVALMQSRATYHRLPREAARFDSAAAFADSPFPVHIAQDGDLAALIVSIQSPAESSPCPT